MDTIDEWVSAVRAYVVAAPKMPARKCRILRAQLDGSWRRLRSDDPAGQMSEAVRQANEQLPEEFQLGFFDPVTGEMVGPGKGIQAVSPSRT